MISAEWIAYQDPRLLEFLRGKATERKLRLFASACCRSIWHLLRDDRSRKAIEAVEHYVDGKITRNDMTTAADAARDAFPGAYAAWGAACSSAAAAAYTTACAEATAAIYAATNAAAACPETQTAELARQANLLQCIFGNPFHPVSVDSSWLHWHDCIVTRMAQAIYDDRTFDCLPILADALEEAGCTKTEILSHCRQQGEHVRGCWVVDLMLGRK